MKIKKALFIDAKDLKDNEYDIYFGLSGENSDSTLVVSVSDMKECLEASIDLNGQTVGDCQGRVWEQNLDKDIAYMTSVLAEVGDAEFIVVLDDEYNLLKK
jgi:hypothetical protein